ncbi:uracil phosphoribosyltransferase [Hydrogenothermus marinus]|uniref:Uracil phosphoribosyltransferase n=1 Tax=Hydrogenothermus marinus TaxID=133270 RepID=A0A3M0BS00_9AQUI|nr:uracil phosphoribosyltransferase [Hydrogenothermus marinus]RMA97275.1 uracil phosphoribosyltransferase [Hydrogenothermus marinus]
MNNIFESKSPLIKHLVSNLRDKNLKGYNFRKYVREIAQLLLFEALKEEKLINKEIETWIGKGNFPFLDEENFVITTILRAGLPMLDGILEIFQNAPAGFLAIKRDEKTLESHVYYIRLPDLKGKTVIITDPMVATGGSLDSALNILKKENPKKIISLNIIGAPEGLKLISEKHPDVNVYIAQIDKKLNNNGYIIPGIGDAGDRAFNT